MAMGEGWRKGYNDFSLKMNSTLSERWVCCVVENLSRVFLSKQPLLLLQVMRVYIIWMKGKKVTLKILQVESFVDTSRVGPSRETLAKLIAQHITLQLPACASHMPFLQVVTLLANFSRSSCETALIHYFILDSSPT